MAALWRHGYFLLFICFFNFMLNDHVFADETITQAGNAATILAVDESGDKDSLWDAAEEKSGGRETQSSFRKDAEATTSENGESLWGDEGKGVQGEKKDFSPSDSTSPWDAGVTVWNKISHDTHDDYPYEGDATNHLRGIVQMEYRKSDRFYAKAAVQGDYFSYHYDEGWENDSDVRLHDAYFNISGAGYNFKIGNQIVRWGKADGYSPLDNINPEDYRDGIAGRREDRKIPVPMANMQVYWNMFTLQGIYIPVFIKSEFDISGTDWAWFDRVDKEIGPYAYEEPDFSPSFEDAQGGARIAVTIHGFDFAFSYLSKINDLPSIDSLWLPPGISLPDGSIRDLPRFTQATGQAIQLRYDRTSIWGIELETTLGDIGVRADIAYNTDVNFLTEGLERIEKPKLDYVIGLDYNSASSLYVNVQFGQTIIQDWDDRITLAKEVTSSITGTISKEFFNGNIKPEFRIYYDLKGDASIYNPKLLIYYWQNLTIDIGAEFFDGEDWTVIGTFKDNDQVYAIIELKF